MTEMAARKRIRITVRRNKRSTRYYGRYWDPADKTQHEVALCTSDYFEAFANARQMETLLSNQDVSPRILAGAHKLDKLVGLVPPESGGVYAITGHPGYVKIGRSGNIRNRIRSLQQASSYKLKLVAILSEAPADEKVLQEKMKVDRMNGEWFRPSPRVTSIILDARRDR